VFVHEFGHFITAKKSGVNVEEFGFGFPPRIFGIKKGETLYSINWIPLGGFVKILGENPITEDQLKPEDRTRSFSDQPAWKRALMLVAGVVANLIAAWFVIALVFMVGAGPDVLVNAITADSPAALAGFAAGDVILNYASADEVISYINQNLGREISFPIKRGELELILSATPRPDPPPGVGALGVSLVDVGIPQTGFLMSFIESFKYTLNLTLAILVGVISIIRNLFLGVAPEVVGPVGIFSLASAIGREGIVYLLHILAVISVNLAILNVLPFPALDGGRLFFLAVEKIKGSPLPKKFELYANLAGFSFLILIFVLITVRDLSVFL